MQCAQTAVSPQSDAATRGTRVLEQDTAEMKSDGLSAIWNERHNNTSRELLDIGEPDGGTMRS